MAANINHWKLYYDKASPETENLPKPYEKIDDILYLIILKCLRPDKIVPAIRVSRSS